MSEGTNAVRKKFLVTTEFDPFKDKTVIYLNHDTEFTVVNKASVCFSFAHHRSAEHDFMRIDVTASTLNRFNTVNDVSFLNLEILADLEIIKPMRVQSSQVTYLVAQDKQGQYYQYTGGGSVDFSISSVKKLASAKKLEARFTCSSYSVDLGDEEERQIKNSFIVLYHESIEQIFPNDVRDITAKLKDAQQTERNKLKSEKQIQKWSYIIAALMIFIYFVFIK